MDVFGFPPEKLVSHVDAFNSRKPKATHHVFHLHGCIPRTDCSDTDTYGHLSNSLILSEDSYIGVEKYGAYNWFNSIQSYYLHYGSCLFVGFSGTDYNFRRILRQRGTKEEDQERKKHYMIVTIDDLYKDIYRNVCQYRKKTPAGFSAGKVAADAKLLLNEVLTTREAYWKDFDFYPIWVSIAEIPEVLLSLLP